MLLLGQFVERFVAHHAVSDYDDQFRMLNRVTLAGDIPVGVDGQRSRWWQAMRRSTPTWCNRYRWQADPCARYSLSISRDIAEFSR